MSGAVPAVPAERLRVEDPAAIDLRLTMAPVAHGRGDPTIRFAADGIWRATRVPSGAATLRIRRRDGAIEADAWGPGAAEALDGVAGLVGATDEIGAFQPAPGVVAEIARRHPGLRLTRTGRAWEALLPAICEQKVTGIEARAAFRGIVRTHGELAPGPGGLWLAPTPERLATLPYFAFHRFGLERRRADIIRRAAAVADRVEVAPPADATRLLDRLPGIGPWTIAEVARVACGDPDAVSVGDYHLPSLVAWALAGEPRAGDERMLELLEPFRGQRGRVQRLLEISGLRPPRYGPRLAPNRIHDR